MSAWITIGEAPKRFCIWPIEMMLLTPKRSLATAAMNSRNAEKSRELLRRRRLCRSIC